MVSPTTASMSLKVYSTKFVKDYKKAIRTSYEGRNLVIEKDLRESYYGGRTEVFIPKLKNGFHYDVNSLYPYVMGKAGLLFPVGDYEERTGTKALIQWQLFLRNGFGGGTIRAKVKIPNDMQYPILPYREFQKLMFPTGTIEGTWTFHELKFACDRGVEVQEVSKTIFFKEMVDLFSKFVTYFEKLKNDNTSTVIDGKKTGLNENGEKVNPSLRSFAKLILNALYGKFATERERTSYTSLKEIEETIERLEKKAEIFTPEIEFFQNLKKMRFRFPGEPGKMMDQAQKEWTQNNDVSLIGRMPYRYANHTLGEELIKYTTYITGEYVQVQISSYVTAYARMVLYEGIENIVSRGGKVYYCDTDSLVSDIELEPHLIHNSEFGKWQLEGKIKKAYFSQPKVYVEETIKGKRTSYKIDLYRNEKKITIQTSNDKIEVNKKFKGLPGAKVQTMTVSDYAYINMRQELKDVDRVELLTKEEGFENIIKPLTAIVQNQDFNKMVKIEKSLLIRGLMEKRKMDYKNNTSTPWSFDQGTQNELKQYFDKVQEENKQFVETWTKQIDIMLKEEGFIQIPKKGTYLYKKYLEIEPKTRRKYFRQKGLHIDYFADKVEYTPEDLLLEFSLEM
jgi:hypothetical protein